MSNIAEVSRIERAEANDITVHEVVTAPETADAAPLEAGPPANDTGPVVPPVDKSTPATRRTRRPDESEQAKRSFGTIMEEADVAIRVYDQEKRRILGITYALSQIEQSFGRLHARFEELERRVDAFAASDNDLRVRFEASIESIRTRDDREAELLKNNFSLRAALSNVERQLGQQADDVRSLGDDNAALLQKIAAMEYDTGLILDEIGHLRDDITVLSSTSEAITPAAAKPAAAPAIRRNELRVVDSTAAEQPRREPEPTVADANDVAGEISSSITFHMNEAALLRARIENLRLAGETAAADRLRTASSASPPEPPLPVPAPDHGSCDHDLSELKALLKAYQEVIRDLDLSRSALLRQSDQVVTGPGAAEPAAVVAPPPVGDIASHPTDLQQQRRLTEGALRTARQERAQLQRELARIRAASARVMQAEAEAAVVTRPRPSEQPAPGNGR
jgi:chromosome segregation ATPase